jgi:hypothetical protein
MMITGCFNTTGLTGVRTQSGEYDMETKTWTNILPLLSHGNDASTCVTERVQPDTNHVVSSIDGFFDSVYVKGMLITWSDKTTTSFGDTTSTKTLKK